MKKHQTTGVYILLIIVLLAFFASLFITDAGAIKRISYSKLLEKVNGGEIQSIIISDDSAVSKAKANDEGFQQKYETIIPFQDAYLRQVLAKNNVDISVMPLDRSAQWLGLIGSLILPLLLVFALFLLLKGAQAGGAQAMSFGKSKAKMMPENKVKVTFADVAGIDEAKQELEEVVDFLKKSDKYIALGAKIPKGVLLVGAPGTGKTLMAKAVAGEAGVPFFTISGSDFVEMFVGVGASRVRDLFEQAKKNVPCIVFIDEIDAVGRQRGAGLGGGHDEREQTLNQLLVEMDGFDTNAGIIIIAATNRPDILDNALLRPGRFDRQVIIDKPDVIGREQILEVHSKDKVLASDVDMKTLAKRTPGFTGADLANFLNESALLAARRNKTEVQMDDVEDAIDKVIAGPEKKNKLISEEEKKVIAYHEVGHALLAKFLKNCDPLHKVTIISRGMALGLTMTLPERDTVLYSKAQLLDQMTMTLGGRAAEEIIFNEITTGAQNDLEKVTGLARKMVMSYGMSEKMGPMTFGRQNEHVFLGRDFGHEKDFSEEVAAMIDQEIKSIIDEKYKLAKKMVVDNRTLIDKIVEQLLERETLDDEEVNEIIATLNGTKNGAENAVKES